MKGTIILVLSILASMIPALALIDHLSVLMTTSSPHINLTTGKPENCERNENVVNIDEGDYYLSLSILVSMIPAPALIDHLSVLMTTSSPHINLTTGNLKVEQIEEMTWYHTWMIRMLPKVILSSGSKKWQILTFYIVYELQRIVHISANRCPFVMVSGWKCCILNERIIKYWKNE